MLVNKLAPSLVLTLLLVVAFHPRTAISQKADAETLNKEGVALVTAEKFKEAVSLFEQAIKLKPDFAEAHYHLGEAYLELGDKKAVDAFKQAIKYKSDFALAYSKLGEAYSNGRDYKKAVDAFTQSLHLDSSSALTHYNLGLAYIASEKTESALAEYKVLQTLNPDLGQDLYNEIYKPTVTVFAGGTVRLAVTAIDAHGAPITDLKAEDLQVIDEGMSEAISLSPMADIPTFLTIVIDTSGSLREMLSFQIVTARKIVQKMGTNDQVALIRFISSDKIETVQKFTSSKRRLLEGIDSLYTEGGLSAVLDAVYLSAQYGAGYKFPNRKVRRVLLLLTDGEDRNSFYTQKQLFTFLRSVDVQIFAIRLAGNQSPNIPGIKRLDPKQSIALLKDMASESGGAAFFPKTDADLVPTVNLIFDLIRNQYAIEYKPTKPIQPGIFRTVSVSLNPATKRDSLALICRKGYLTPK